MEQTSSKNVVLWTIVLIVIIVSIIGLTFAFFTYSRLSTTETTLQMGKMMFGYTEESNGISLINAIPISDERAMDSVNENSYFDFYITYNFPTTTTIYYEIDLEDVTKELDEIQNGSLTSIDYSRIKVALENRNQVQKNRVLSVEPIYFSELINTPAANDKKGYKLYNQTTTGSNTDYYRLYMWIPEYDQANVGIPLIDLDGVQGIQQQVFSVKVNVQSNVKVTS